MANLLFIENDVDASNFKTMTSEILLAIGVKGGPCAQLMSIICAMKPDVSFFLIYGFCLGFSSQEE